MTDSKAISCLKADKEYLVDNSVCDGEEIDIAIKALEKQIPKKPSKCIGFSNSLFICPTCGRKQAIMYEQYHCKECGQKLDWRMKYETD